jgi:ABC-type multidrug transport system ATPase subunit
VIEVKDLVARARRPAVALGPVTFTLEAPGSYALVGGQVDGVPLLLAVLAGAVAPVTGEVKLGGQPPGPRSTVAYVPFVADLPSSLRVGELLNLSAHVRGEKAAPPEERLEVLGLGVLARRSVGSLSFPEAHAVALVEAVTSEASLLLLEEPMSDLDPRAFARLADALEARVRTGATVVVSTASLDDACELADDQLYFERGKLVRQATRDDAWVLLTSKGARLVVRSEEARALLAALATEKDVLDVASDGPSLTLSGKDPVALAAAVGRAARKAEVEIDLVEFSAGEP